MALFRKKPVTIEARQFTGDVSSSAQIVEWAEEFETEISVDLNDDDCNVLLIPTLKGTMTAIAGDWIIRGVKDEFYPCKPDIFRATYEPVEGHAEEGEKMEAEARQ